MTGNISKVAKSASNVFPVSKKYTLQSTGIWERIRRLLAVDPDRSSGIPLNPQFRNPPPGALPPQSYDDPVTLPAGDIADNPYWKRDVRRSYPRLSVVNQGDVVGLLTVGSKATPKDDVLRVGEAGTMQLVALKQDGEERGLSVFFKNTKSFHSVLGSDKLPPPPCNLHASSSRCQLGSGQGFPESYPCRTFV